MASGPYGTHVDDSGRPQAAAADGRLKVSAAMLDELSSPSFGLLEVTFENETASWIRIGRAAIDFGSARLNRAISIPSGADLEAWRLAMVERTLIDPSVARSLPARFALGASPRDRHGDGPASATSESPPEGTQPFPGYHLFSVPFAVPPGLFAKRWVVLNTPRGVEGCIRRVIVEYETETGHRERVAVQVRETEPGESEWQSPQCR